MSTQFSNTFLEHTSDATYRAWRDEIITLIDAANAASGKWQRSSDTGQVTAGAGTRPAVSTVGGYIILQCIDTLAGASPIFIKIEFGTGTAAANPQMWIQVGTSTNGSGTLTGFTSTRQIWTRNVPPNSVSTLYPTYVSSNEGSITLGWKAGGAAGNGGMGMFGVGRPCDLSGALKSDAIVIYYHAGAVTVWGAEVLRVSDGVKFGGTSNRDCCLVVYGVTASTVAGSFQAYQHVCAYPGIAGINWMGTVLGTELALNTQDTATFFGATPHNYVSLGGANSFPGFSTTQTTAHCPFMLYE